MKGQEPIISFRDAEILNGETKVLYGLNFEVRPGDFFYIVGKVGTGKTSIIKTIIAENPTGHGHYHVCGYDLTDIRPREIPYLRRNIGVVFQDFQLLMDRSVQDNLLFVLKATGWKDERAMDCRISEVLQAVDMTSKAHRMPHQLSGGEQQRIAIARALLNNPTVIVADEPTGNLDNDTADGIMTLLTGINKKYGTAVIMVTHNTAICDRYPGRVMYCSKEKCVEI